MTSKRWRRSPEKGRSSEHYYGLPLLKPPVWTWEIPAYFFVGGAAGAAAAPAPEDWGWYVYVKGAGASYLVGASADTRETRRNIDWTVQIQRQRSLKDRITGANTLTIDDPLSALIEKIIRADADIGEIDVDRNA